MNDTTTWKIDPAHTDVAFSAKHMMVTTVRGKFDRRRRRARARRGQPDGRQRRDPHRGLQPVDGLRARDQHLRSADFFDAERHPGIVARSI